MNKINTLFAALLSGLVLQMAASCNTDTSIVLQTNINSDSLVLTEGSPEMFTYTIVSGTGAATFTTNASSNVYVIVLPSSDKMSGTLVVSIDEYQEGSFFELTASNEKNSVTERFEVEMETILRDGDASIQVPAVGGNIELGIKINVDDTVTIPADAESWISYVETKTIVSKKVVLKIAANEGVGRSASVKVSTPSGLYEKFTITQAGVLNNLIVTFGQNEVVAPTLLGSNPSGTILWGDGSQLPWQAGAQHIYNDSRTNHECQIQTKASSFRFDQMEGVVKLDLRFFN